MTEMYFNGYNFMKLTDYHAKYFAHELTKRFSSDNIGKLAGALVDAQVDLNPHQVEAALFAFQSPLAFEICELENLKKDFLRSNHWQNSQSVDMLSINNKIKKGQETILIIEEKYLEEKEKLFSSYHK